MRMEQYLTLTNHALWEVIVNGDFVSLVASASTGAEGPIPPKTTEQKLARKNELNAKSTLMLAIPDEHILNNTNETVNTAHITPILIVGQLEFGTNDADDHEEMISYASAILTIRVKRFIKENREGSWI
ncbi:hypothetical protein Tco_0413712 [Tanacetum coccineum]